MLLSLLTTTIVGVIAVANGEKQQFTIQQDNFNNVSSYGEKTDNKLYTEFYNAKKAFDGLVNEDSYFAQLGKAGFDVKFDKLNKSVCWAEIGVLKPQQKVPFNIVFFNDKGNNKSFNGILDKQITTLDFTGLNNKCLPNLNEIKFDVNGKSNQYTAVSEIKLFEDSKVPPIEPPVCPDGQKYDPNTKKCVDINPPEPPKPNQTASITNSTINFVVSNSTVNLKADSTSDVVISVEAGGNVTTVTDNSTIITPQIPTTTTTPIGTPLPPQEEKEEESQEDDNKEDNKKDSKKDKNKGDN